ncbi:MAG: tetratricopeptide repeat protein, partial [Aureispira sp.]
MGNLYKDQERYEEALKVYNSNKQIAQNIKDTLVESNAYQDIGGVYLLEGKWKKAVNSYLTSKDLKEKIGDKKGVAHLQHNLAMVYFEQKQYDTSLEYYQKCTDYYNTQQDTAELLEIWSNTASVHIAQQKYEQATTLLNQVLPLLEQFPNPTIALKVQMNLADIYLKKENYQAALELFKNSLEAAQQQEDYFNLVTVYNFLGSTYCSLKDYKQSIFYYQEALSLSTKLNLLYEQNLALFGLYKSYDAQGNTSKALYWYKQYNSTKDSLYNIATTNRISELQAEYDSREKERVIEALSLENQNITLAKQLQTKQLYLVLLGSALLLSGVGIRWWYRQKTLVHQQEISDLIKEQEVETLAVVLSAEQKERKRLAREIHDTLGTFLALLRLQHQSNEGLVDDPTYQERHLIMKDLIKQTTTEMRRITHQMNTGVHFSFNLQHAIEQLVRLVQTLQKIEITFNYMGEDMELSRMIELTLYRVTQESLSNILRHAQATEVTVQFNQSADEITLMIEDNGRGFDSTIPSKGIGLRNMRERVEALEGTLGIDSSPKKGTCIDVQIPIP